MSGTIALIIIVTTAITSFISGIFGMAGGMILMGVLLWITPLATAMVTHGLIMAVANGWRAFLLRTHIKWRVFGFYMIGAALGTALLYLVIWRPDKQAAYLLLGLVPVIVWLPKGWMKLDIQRPYQSVIAGAIVQGMNTLAGVAGPLLDIFFVRTAMTRQEIVATKSATQVVSHIVKMGFWSTPLILAFLSQETSVDTSLWPPLWLFAAAIPASMFATWLGRSVLNRMKDADFQTWVKALITIIGVVYLYRAWDLWQASGA